MGFGEAMSMMLGRYDFTMFRHIIPNFMLYEQRNMHAL